MIGINLRQHTKKNFDKELEEKYRTLRNIVVHKKRSAKAQDFNKKINQKSKNSKKFIRH